MKKTDKIVAGLQGVPETMLLTLYARANYSRMYGKVFYDAKSVEIANRLDYDFTEAARYSDLGLVTLSRTLVLDKLVKKFVEQNPDGVVVNIASGLDTRFFRVDNGRILWYDVDLPETMEVRKKFFADTNRMKGIAASAMSKEWAESIEVRGRKTLVIIEGLSMYLGDKEIRKIFDIVREHFSNAEVLMEIMPERHVKNNSYSSIKTTSAKFSWGVDSGKKLGIEGFSWKTDHSVVGAMRKVKPSTMLWSWLPGVRRNSEKIAVFHRDPDIIKMSSAVDDVCNARLVC